MKKKKISNGEIEALSNAPTCTFPKYTTQFILKSASNLNGNLNCSKELEHYAS